MGIYTCPDGRECQTTTAFKAKCNFYDPKCWPCDIANCPFETLYNIGECPVTDCGPAPPPPAPPASSVAAVLTCAVGSLAFIVIVGCILRQRRLRNLRLRIAAQDRDDTDEAAAMYFAGRIHSDPIWREQARAAVTEATLAAVNAAAELFAAQQEQRSCSSQATDEEEASRTRARELLGLEKSSSDSTSEETLELRPLIVASAPDQ